MSQSRLLLSFVLFHFCSCHLFMLPFVTVSYHTLSDICKLFVGFLGKTGNEKSFHDNIVKILPGMNKEFGFDLC